ERGTANAEEEAGAEISALVNYVQPVHFSSFEISEKFPAWMPNMQYSCRDKNILYLDTYKEKPKTRQGLNPSKQDPKSSAIFK
ncbi:hypothetical protein SK128_002734, partial [Halocaridina rubra]